MSVRSNNSSTIGLNLCISISKSSMLSTNVVKQASSQVKASLIKTSLCLVLLKWTLFLQIDEKLLQSQYSGAVGRICIERDYFLYFMYLIHSSQLWLGSSDRGVTEFSTGMSKIARRSVSYESSSYTAGFISSMNLPSLYYLFICSKTSGLSMNIENIVWPS